MLCLKTTWLRVQKEGYVVILKPRVCAFVGLFDINHPRTRSNTYPHPLFIYTLLCLQAPKFMNQPWPTPFRSSTTIHTPTKTSSATWHDTLHPHLYLLCCNHCLCVPVQRIVHVQRTHDAQLAAGGIVDGGNKRAMGAKELHTQRERDRNEYRGW